MNTQKKEATSSAVGALRPVEVSCDFATINEIASALREHSANLNYTFRDENTYKSLTDFFVINMVIKAIPLIGANMDHVKMHVMQILLPHKHKESAMA